MKMSMGIVIVLPVLALGLGGCGSSSVPSAPSPVPQATSSVPEVSPPSILNVLVMFTDSATGFSTSDVRDAQEQIVRFSISDELIWVADGTRFWEYIADGNFIAYHHKGDKFFQVRFGRKDGEQRAYLTWTDDRLKGTTATLLDLSVDGRGDLIIAETSVRVPGT